MTLSVAPGETADPTGVPPIRPGRAYAALGHNAIAIVALAIIVVITVLVFAASLLPVQPPLEQDLFGALTGPSPEHLLGTDALGRDILSRLLFGGQPALSGVLVAVVVFAAVGLVLGLLSGYLGGVVDRIIIAVLDVMLSVPGIIVILAVLAIFNQNVFAAMVTLGFFASATLARVIRSACISLREELFVDAARVSGLGPFRIMTRHVLPSVAGQMLIQMSLFAGIALGVQTGLGFLGLGTQAPQPSWGGMVGEAAQVIQQAPSFLLITGGTIGIMTVAFGLLGDGLRDLESGRRKLAGSGSGSLRALSEGNGPEVSPNPADASALLTVRDYSVAFSTPAGTKRVVDSISFTVQPGEIFGLVGESGSGKTVTAHSLLGLLPENGAVIAGSAWLGSRRISSLPERELQQIRGREIGLVSQEPMVALDPLYTIGSQLTEVVRRIGAVNGGKASVRTRALELLASVHLPEPQDVMRKYPHELSGGMVQRVVIALALAGSPRLLIADEPTTALDVTVQSGILDLLRSLRDERGMGIILVTHDLGVVADICDRAIVMQNGLIVEQGSLDEIFYAPKDAYTKRLVESTPNIARSIGA